LREKDIRYESPDENVNNANNINRKSKYNDQKQIAQNREQQYESSPQHRQQYTENKNRTNNYQRTYTKNLENNHYRTIEDLYKHSPKAPVYYSKESSNNQKANNYNQLNYLLSKRFHETDNFYNRNKDSHGQNKYNKYESDYGKKKPKYDITNAMNILLDKDTNKDF